MELATVSSVPLLIVFVVEGASRDRVVSVFWLSNAPNIDAAGLLFCLLESWRSLSCRLRCSSPSAAAAAAPVCGIGENLGDKPAISFISFISLGDLGIGDAFNPALAIDVRFGSFGDRSEEILGSVVLRITWFSASEFDTALGR
jgi:hypothetical protein